MEKYVVKRHGYAAHYQVHEFVETESGEAICGIWNPDGPIGHNERTKMAERIVACLNACEGIPIEELRSRTSRVAPCLTD